MLNFNLLRQEQPLTAGPREKELREKFSVDPTTELLQLLSRERTPEGIADAQARANEIFSAERRDNMLQRASKTPLGLPTVYYRYIPRKQLLTMLENGIQTPQDYIETKSVDAAVFNVFLNMQHYEEGKGKLSREILADFESQDLQTKMQRLFPQAPKSEVEEIVRNLRYADIQKFLDRYVSNADKRLSHKVGFPGIELSNMLSASAGGPIIASGGMAREDVVYIEFIAPDSRVITHDKNLMDFMEESMDGADEEKEVFFKTIPTEWITRVFVDRKQLIQEAMENPESTIQHFSRKHPSVNPADTNPYRNWHKNAKTKDMLPASIARRFERKQKEPK